MTTTEKPAPTPRLISREVQKAETKLIHLRRLKTESLAHHEAAWDAKRAIFIENLPADVRRMLVAGGVLSEAEVTDAVAE